jgi:hypothetical protein
MANTILDTTITNIQLPTSRIFQTHTNNFVYNGGAPSFVVENAIKNIISIKINGLEETKNIGYHIENKTNVVFNYNPIIPSTVSINYSF